ncbi:MULTISPECIES: DUF6361 family protein [Sinorhizobium]|uniref:Uncharacterized protein n=1 Tax=Sinorhizobium americanum TaxID=194963 RepID=A0A2S3YUH9_9HYPH|nr:MULTISPECIES: DUF6361 family protein [Sinorhizobium]PDT39364.1 hypothetical protein CO656_22665 [Sinorhizobium sp. FG01]PDT50699.1 hypothetical protein CO664_24780 [Sinorhizobium sp. NG07B]POH34041.1 hypothetical protein ATY30_00005 [Sinorhizobium americanum]POH35294.1 hypothetical protein ATY31_03615 [Sinorhizobium americanum]
MSYLAWIDFDPEERRRAQTLIDLFKQPEARDELGLGTVRDGLADLLFPGTSTIQTRLRYMLFIPWTYCEAQSRKATQAERTNIARDLEFRLSEALLRGNETTGVIGRDAGRDLKRLASSVYWAGLNTLGIRTMMGSQATFLSYGPESLKDHDLKLWSSSLPKAPEDLFEQATFALTLKEADFLRDRIASNAKPSLLNELARTGKPFSQDWPWQVGESTISKFNRSLLRHAERFSGVMYGASLLYNLLLALRAAERPNAKKHADASALMEHYRSRLDDWRTKLEFLDLDSWDLDDLFSLIGTTSHSLTKASRDFIRGWASIARSGAKHLETDSSAIELLKHRERDLKRLKARLLHDAPLERWSGASGDARLDFRWGISRNYLGELADAG